MITILTNISAMSAGQKLRDVNYNLDVVQDRVASGLRVADAADNAAYWSIAKIMKSDNAALSAVSDAIGLGASKVDIAKAGMDKTIEVISNIKSKLVAALEHGTDANSVQEEINQLQDQLKGIAEGASFNGENWLKASLGSPTSKVTKSVVSSFIRTHDGDARVTNIEYNLDADSVLFDSSNGSRRYGILDKNAVSNSEAQSLRNVSVQLQDKSGKISNTSLLLATVSGAWLKGAQATFDQGLGVAVISNQSSAPGSGVSSSDASNSSTGVNDVYLRVGEDMWVLGSTKEPTHKINDKSIVPFIQKDSTKYYINTSQTTVNDEKYSNIDLGYSITTLDITQHSNSDMYTESDSMQKMLSFVDRQLKNVTAAAGKIGSISSRIHLQEDFVQFMRNSIEKGIGRLVDSDMAAESSRLAALQTQQQLAIQALSIANSSSQRTLSLFR
ncbi:MAG: flagellin [Candidatus Liberibacter europaeus]|uniref:Flagellin n=1 Tax=Candidatus Liberibacter europaeus TaxID=744859 RepID=A0A2T4VXX7_9HYPH|nr:flagellin [Candidatus Liberibacter europaeus]PTL86629.1 MAG: flagellin [Candidatus Liberibacter europaeus]